MVGLMLMLAVVSGVAVGVLLDGVLLALVISTGFLFLAGFASYKRLTSAPPPPPRDQP
jgi:hypothetical protein